MYPKVSAGSLHAFESPNIAPLATVGISIQVSIYLSTVYTSLVSISIFLYLLSVSVHVQVDTKAVWRPGTISALTVQSRLCRDVVLLRLFPSIRSGSRVSCCHVWSRVTRVAGRRPSGTSWRRPSAAWCCSATGRVTCPATGRITRYLDIYNI